MRPNQIHISSSALINNVAHVRSLISDAKILACIKANAYGHNAGFVAKSLTNQVEAFAVARVEEAIELRDHEIDRPILVLSGASSREEAAIMCDYNLWTVVATERQAEMVSVYTLDQVWIKHNSGMNRLGFTSDRFRNYVEQFLDKGVDVVAMSHLACGDQVQTTNHQINNFHQACVGFKIEKSMANSAAIISNQASHMQWVRPGLMLYGVSPIVQEDIQRQLRPAMHFYAHIMARLEVAKGEYVGYGQKWRTDRDSTIFLVSAGYADGYPYQVLEKATVYVNGELAPVVGRTSMDMLAIDVTDIHLPDDTVLVELWGDNIRLDQLAQDNDLLSYNLLCHAGKRAHWVFD